MHFTTLIGKNLMRRPIRSFLTVLGVAIAVGTTVAFMSVSAGLRKSTSQALSDRGIDLVVLERGAIDQLNSELDESLVSSVAELPHVRAVAPTLIDLLALEWDGNTVNAFVQGWLPGSVLFDGLKFKSGRSLKSDDLGKAVVGFVLADRLKKNIGQTLVLDDEPFEIVGIYESFVPTENSGAIIVLQEMQRIMFHPQRITGLAVLVDPNFHSATDMESLRQRIESLSLPGGKPGRAKTFAVRDYVADAAYIRIADAMAWITTAIAVIVGTIGILNTMVMSVAERLREICVLRAMGWRKQRVIRMIMGESLVLGFLGAIAGIVLAVILAQVVTSVREFSGLIPTRITLPVVGVGFLLALGGSLLGGIYPALRAAQLSPADGVRYE